MNAERGTAEPKTPPPTAAAHGGRGGARRRVVQPANALPSRLFRLLGFATTSRARISEAGRVLETAWATMLLEPAFRVGIRVSSSTQSDNVMRTGEPGRDETDGSG